MEILGDLPITFNSTVKLYYYVNRHKAAYLSVYLCQNDDKHIPTNPNMINSVQSANQLTNQTISIQTESILSQF
jgi:hypothetical protein